MSINIKHILLGLQIDDPRLFDAINALVDHVVELETRIGNLENDIIPGNLPSLASNNAARARGLKIGDYYTESGSNPLRICRVF